MVKSIGCHPDRVDEFKAGVDTAIRYARVLGCPKVNCLAGIAPKDAQAELLDATLVANLQYAAPRFRAAGMPSGCWWRRGTMRSRSSTTSTTCR